jgi:hypothetical protein
LCINDGRIIRVPSSPPTENTPRKKARRSDAVAAKAADTALMPAPDSDTPSYAKKTKKDRSPISTLPDFNSGDVVSKKRQRSSSDQLESSKALKVYAELTDITRDALVIFLRKWFETPKFHNKWEDVWSTYCLRSKVPSLSFEDFTVVR